MSREMTIGLLAVSSVLFVASLFGVYQAFSRPTETEQPVTLEYRHEGKFDYLAYTKPSYLYGTSESPLASSRYFLKLIESLTMTYSYHSDSTVPREVQVTAVLENPGVWKKTVVLVPRTTRPGDFDISFAVDLLHFQELARTVEEETGARATSGYDVTIVVTVSDVSTDGELADLGFRHTLPMKLTGSFIEVSDDLVHRYGSSYGEFDYTVELRPNSLFASTTLKPPAAPQNPGVTALGPEDTVFLSLLDALALTFSHSLQADFPISLLEAAVEVDATIGDPEKWSKTIVLVPTTKTSGPLTVSFPLDLRRFTEALDTIQREVGISAPARSLTITARVRVLAQTEFGQIDDEFSQSIVTDLSGDLLTWSGGLEKSEPRPLETTRTIRKQERYLGLPVAPARALFAILSGIACGLLLFSVWMYLRGRPEELAEADKRAQRAAKKYKDIIVEAKDLPVVQPGENVIPLDSLDDLIRAAQGLLKPVVHRADKGKHIYTVLDGTTRYQYLLAEDTPDTPRTMHTMP